jgi:hypothetical protein
MDFPVTEQLALMKEASSYVQHIVHAGSIRFVTENELKTSVGETSHEKLQYYNVGRRPDRERACTRFDAEFASDGPLSCMI